MDCQKKHLQVEWMMNDDPKMWIYIYIYVYIYIYIYGRVQDFLELFDTNGEIWNKKGFDKWAIGAFVVISELNFHEISRSVSRPQALSFNKKFDC